MLFDTGANGATLLANMAALGLDPKAIEAVFLSHIHRDHTGGLDSLLEMNLHIAVYLPRGVPNPFLGEDSCRCCNGRGSGRPQEIRSGLWSTGQMGTGILEQGLVSRTEEGLVVVTGCAHPGIDKMATRARQVGRDNIALVTGGIHPGGARQERITEIIDKFRRLGVRQVAPCHCTGGRARKLLQESYGREFTTGGVGWRWESQALIRTPDDRGSSAEMPRRPDSRDELPERNRQRPPSCRMAAASTLGAKRRDCTVAIWLDMHCRRPGPPGVR